VRVLEKGWQRAEQLGSAQLKVGKLRNEKRPING